MEKVAVITPYYNESIDELRRCFDSVVSQTHPCTQVFVSDGKPTEEIDDWDVTHIRLPNHADYGDTPRALGAMSAAVLGFDAVSFLDADNWYEHGHIASLVELCRETGASVATSGRMLRRPDGSVLAPCGDSDGETFCDTNCYLITRASFDLFPAWIYKDKRYSCVGDRIFWARIKNSGCKRAHLSAHSVNYVSLSSGDYIKNGELPPPGAKVMLSTKNGMQFSIVSLDEILDKNFNVAPWRIPPVISEAAPWLLKELRPDMESSTKSNNAQEKPE